MKPKGIRIKRKVLPGGTVAQVCPAQLADSAGRTLTCNDCGLCVPETLRKRNMIIVFIEHARGMCYAWGGTPLWGMLSAQRAHRKGADHSLDTCLEKRHKAARYARLGAIGDPRSLGLFAMRSIARKLKAAGLGMIGYTHGWKLSPWLKPYVCASTGGMTEAVTAHAQGWGVTTIQTKEEWQ